jgi:FMN-dependent NADH-azoreductase
MPQGLCSAKRLTYVTTAGGPIFDEAFGYGYVKALATTFYGIRETRMIKAENLDIHGADVEGIMRRAMAEIDKC